MLSVMRFVRGLRPGRLLAYSLVMKRGSCFLPHYFGVVVDDHDRILFLLDAIPNNRLFAGTSPPIGLFRRIEKEDAARRQQYLDTGVP